MLRYVVVELKITIEEKDLSFSMDVYLGIGLDIYFTKTVRFLTNCISAALMSPTRNSPTVAVNKLLLRDLLVDSHRLDVILDVIVFF